MTAPIISVIIPTYDRRHVIDRSVDSVLRQEMDRFELIVVDDGSTDGTAEYLAKKYDDPRVRMIVQENAGVCVARNSGVEAASCGFVTFLDSDDEACPGWLAFYASAIDSEHQLASCALHWVGPGSLYSVRAPERMGRAFGDLHALFLPGAFGLEKSLLHEVGGFRPGLRFSEHTDLALRLGGLMLDRPFRAMHLDEPFVTFHREERPYDPALQYESSMTLLREDMVHLERSPKLLATYLGIAGVAASKLGRHDESRRLLARAIRAHPLWAKNYLRLAREMAFGR